MKPAGYFLICWIFLSGAVARAGHPVPAPLQPATGTVTLRAEARTVSPVSGAPEELHWVLLGAPSFALPSERGKADIQRRLAAASQALSTAGCQVQVILARSVCNLLASIESDTLLIDLGPLGTPPAAPAAAKDFTLTFDYTETPPATIERLTFEIWTESAQNPANNPASVAFGQTQAMERRSCRPLAELESVEIAVHYTEADRSRGPRVEPFPSNRIEDALLDIACLALGPLRAGGMVPKKPAPDDEMVPQQMDAEIATLLSANIRNWPRPVANVQYADDTRTAVNVEIRGLQVVAFARIDVERGQIVDADGQLVNFRGADRVEREVREDLQHAQNVLMEIFRMPLEGLEGRVPTAAEVAAIRENLGRRREIRGNPRVEGYPGGNLVYKDTRAWVIGKLDAKLQAMFTPEDLLTGGGTLTGEKLLYNIFKYDFGETYSYSLRTGSTVQDSQFVLGFPRTRGQNWIANYGGDVTGLYLRDTKQMVGAAASATERELTEREKGVQPRVYLEITKAAGSRWPLVTRIDALFDRRNLLLRPNSGAADLTNGRLAAPTLRLREAFGYVARPAEENASGRGLDNMTFDVNGEGRKGIHSLGGDFDFRQYLVSARVESIFGVRSRRDFLLRYRRGIGGSSAQTPLYQVFRLGGSNGLRGIEEGEFFGRSIGFTQVDAGINVQLLWRLIHRPKPPNPDAPPVEAGPPGPPPPISLDQIYVTVFYDRAEVGDRLSLTKPYWGRGIAAEIRGMRAGLRRTNLSIGYARSPQSILHRKGVMTVGVSFDLY